MTQQEFAQFYDRYYRLVYWIGFKVTQHRAYSKDIAQNVFLKVWMMESSLLTKGFFITCAYNESKDYLRTFAVSKTSYFPDLYDIQTEDVKNTLIEISVIDKLIEELSPACKNVFLLLKEGYSTKEIAIKNKIDVQTVRNQKAIAIHKIREQVLKYKITL